VLINVGKSFSLTRPSNSGRFSSPRASTIFVGLRSVIFSLINIVGIDFLIISAGSGN